jgi:hypothetical protein
MTYPMVAHLVMHNALIPSWLPCLISWEYGAFLARMEGRR